MMEKRYLGDSVYIAEEPGHNGIRLTTENGYGPSNEIILEPDVVVALVKFLEEMAECDKEAK